MGKLAYVSVAVGSDSYETDLLATRRSPVKIPRHSHLDPNTTEVQNTPIIQKQTSTIMFNDYADDYENDGYVSVEDGSEEVSNPIPSPGADRTESKEHRSPRKSKTGTYFTRDESFDSEASSEEPPTTLTNVTRMVSDYLKDTVTDWTNTIANYLPAPENQLAPVNDYVDDDIYAREMEKNLGYDTKSVPGSKDNMKNTVYTKLTKGLNSVKDVLFGRKSTLKDDNRWEKRIDAYKRYAGDVLDYDENSHGMENGIMGRRSSRNRKPFCCFCIPIG